MMRRLMIAVLAFAAVAQGAQFWQSRQLTLAPAAEAEEIVAFSEAWESVRRAIDKLGRRYQVDKLQNDRLESELKWLRENATWGKPEEAKK